MIAMATDETICVLDFLDQTTWYRDQAEVLLRLEAKDMAQENALLLELEKQLKEYFAKERKEFTLPITLVGTPFRKKCGRYCKPFRMAKRALIKNKQLL